MANLDKKLLEQQAAGTQQQTASTVAAPSTPQASAAAPTSPAMQGVTQNTQTQLGKYQQGYAPSASVTQAQQYLDGVISGKPGEYQSQYQAQLNDLYNQVMNRPGFTFNLNGNALYEQYRDKYMQSGRRAMMDTMGQAAAMTGGYGNSYASTAGNQAYQQYLQQLNDVVPELYQMELDRYNNEGNRLLQQYEMTAGLENDAYGRYRDTVGDWESERAYAQNAYQQQYEQDYQNWVNMLNHWSQQAQQEYGAYMDQQQFDAQQAAQNREYAYNQAMAILAAGKMPTAELLAAAGISSADATNLMAKKSSGSSSSKKSSSGGTGTKPTTAASLISKYDELSDAAKTVYANLAPKKGRYGPVTTSEATVKNIVANNLNSGRITGAEADYILRAYGY